MPHWKHVTVYLSNGEEYRIYHPTVVFSCVDSSILRRWAFWASRYLYHFSGAWVSEVRDNYRREM